MQTVERLLAPFESVVVDVTVAVLHNDTGDTGFTTILTVAFAPLARGARSHTTAVVQVAPVAETNVAPAGSGSVTIGTAAFPGPLLRTESV